MLLVNVLFQLIEPYDRLALVGKVLSGGDCRGPSGVGCSIFCLERAQWCSLCAAPLAEVDIGYAAGIFFWRIL